MSVLLVDGNNLLTRALWAKRLQDMKVGGRVTGPLHAFLGSLSRLVCDERPDRLLVAWDGGPSAHRIELDPRYKAHRQSWGPDERTRRDDSYALAEQFCDLAGIPQLRLPDMEADDLIAGAWQHLEPEGGEDVITIASADHDFGQLLGFNPHGMTTEQIRWGSANRQGKTDTDRWTEQTLRDHDGWEPWQAPLVMALMGDPGDGVGGVPGVGEKKAPKLLEAQNWNWDRTVAELGRTHGAEVARQAEIDLQLVDLRHVELVVEVPHFQPTTRHGEDGPALEAWLERYALTQIGTKFRAGTLWTAREQVQMPTRRWGCPPNG